MKLKLRRIIAGLKSERAYNISFLRLVQLISKWGIIILTVLIALSGLIYYEWFAVIFADFFLFSWHMDYDILLLIFIIIHVGVGSKFFLTRKRIKGWSYDLIIGSLILSLSITVMYLNFTPELVPPEIRIGRERYRFDPLEVDTVRPDLFQNGSFSVFDILVYLESEGKISLTVHFNASMDTYVIDSLNEEINWW